jgi:L-amino acid N-acyltransferase YncA
MTIAVRLADPQRDAAATAAIYRPLVEKSHTSFEAVAPDAVEMASRIERTLRIHPWLVAEDAGSVVGYAYAAPHRERAAYRWSVDVSVYLHEEARGRGIGRRLYDRLLPIIGDQGYANVYAGIALPNPASEALHRSVGMELIGIYRQVGFKFGKWWDVAWYGMRLPTAKPEPHEPIPFAVLRARRPFPQ